MKPRRLGASVRASLREWPRPRSNGTQVAQLDAAVLVVVQPGERNWVDQQWLQDALWRGHRVRTVRASLAEVAAAGSIAADGSLRVHGTPVSVVYFRSGRAPHAARSVRCRSQVCSHVLCGALQVHTGGLPRGAGVGGPRAAGALQCGQVPFRQARQRRSAPLHHATTYILDRVRRLAVSDRDPARVRSWHLAGAKKVQQALAAPGAVERFVSAADAAVLRRSFAGLWALDGGRPTPLCSILREPDWAIAAPDTSAPVL